MSPQAHQMIHDAVNKTLQETGDLVGTYAALCVAVKTVEVLYTIEVEKAQKEAKTSTQQ